MAPSKPMNFLNHPAVTVDVMKPSVPGAPVDSPVSQVKVHRTSLKSHCPPTDLQHPLHSRVQSGSPQGQESAFCSDRHDMFTALWDVAHEKSVVTHDAMSVVSNGGLSSYCSGRVIPRSGIPWQLGTPMLRMPETPDAE